MTKTIGNAEFEEMVLKSDIPVLVDFYADWCGPCRMMMPIVDRLAADAGGSYAVYKINVDKDQELAGKYTIMTIPSLIIFKGGKEVDRTVGAVTYDALLNKLNNV